MFCGHFNSFLCFGLVTTNDSQLQQDQLCPCYCLLGIISDVGGSTEYTVRYMVANEIINFENRAVCVLVVERSFFTTNIPFIN